MNVNRNLECSPIVAGDSLPKRSRELLPITNPADETVLGSLVCATLDDVGNALKLRKVSVARGGNIGHSNAAQSLRGRPTSCEVVSKKTPNF
jgi:hypothetical protein